MTATLKDWRALVEKDLAGKSFEAALVRRVLDGVSLEPLYTEAPTLPRALGTEPPVSAGSPLGAPFRVCMRIDASARPEDAAADLAGGADTLWLEEGTSVPAGSRSLLVDRASDACSLDGEDAALIATLAHHEAGADAADEIAVALSTCVARLAKGPRRIVVRVAVGAETFVELSKLRALRLCLRKVLTAVGVADRTSIVIHAVGSTRTLTVREPWVNMLRVVTQTFAAILGGAELVTPRAFDELLQAPSPLGRRVARNTALVLRDESGLGRVMDPAAGSYFFDTLADALAREAWTRFRALERDGGITSETTQRRLGERFEANLRARRDAIAKRKIPILGVSEFANLDEALPSPPRVDGSIARRDAASFEALRARAEASPREALLVTLGPPAEWRPRASFAAGLLAAGGIRTREAETAGGLVGEPGRGSPNPSGAASIASIACLCGSDERYASEAATKARELKAAGYKRVLLAGRPGALEAELRAAGVDGFIFLGCDTLSVLDALLEAM